MKKNRLIWLSDLHLNLCDRDTVCEFMDSLDIIDADGIVISGDIGDADTVVDYLENMACEVNRPIYFVLGNHDFYGGSFSSIYSDICKLHHKDERLTYLSDISSRTPIKLSGTTVLIGEDGWCDGQLGNIKKSALQLNDFVLIDELKGLCKQDKIDKIWDLGYSQSTNCLGKLLRATEQGYKNIILATHVPPFAGASWHEGKQSGDDWLPYFACKAMGDVILEVMKDNPDTKLTVLCGHTHSRGMYKPLPNVWVHTAQAKYGKPEIQQVLDLDIK